MYVLPNLVFVWPSNWGSGSLTDITAVRPSLISSPVKFPSFSFINLLRLAYSFTVLVKADLKPAKWVPPSCVSILFANEYIFSVYPSVYCIAISTIESPIFLSIWTISSCIGVFVLFKYFTNSTNPPS